MQTNQQTFVETFDTIYYYKHVSPEKIREVLQAHSDDSRLILSARVDKHTDELLEELVVSTEGKTDCKNWNSDA